MKIKKLEYKISSDEIFNKLKDREYLFFLDSGMDHERLGRYSFLGFDPFLIFTSKGTEVTINEFGELKKFESDPFIKLEEVLKKYKLNYKSEFPFIGGCVGFFSYDLCHHIEKLPRKAIDDVNIYDIFLGFYDGIIIIDNLSSEIFISALGIKDTEDKVISNIEDILRSINRSEVKNYIKKNIKFRSNFTKEEYLLAVDKIKDYIRSGDIYQANLTQRFECIIEESPYDIYNRLRKINPAPFASFLDFKEGYILSSSPERFIKVTDNIIETRPIKGTIQRGKDFYEDELNKKKLLSSEKDKSELLMIVDLERNDIGKISKTGSVKVTELFHLETYPTVFHLVSTIKGELRKDINPVDCIRATFPGGSITGAPKIRAMEIIDEIEPTQRNIYTGSIGYIGFNGDMDLNIVIRTILIKENKAYFQVGGGIVWDSDPNKEFEESLHKGKALFNALMGE